MPFDGKSHFCAKCGKAGFKSEMAVRGHLGSCEGKAGVVREIRNLALEGEQEAATRLVQAAAAAPAPAAPAAAPASGDVLRMRTLEKDNARLRVALANSQKREATATRYATNHVPHLLGSAPGTGVGALFPPQIKTIFLAVALIWLLDVMRKDESDFKKKVVSKVGDHLIGRVFG